MVSILNGTFSGRSDAVLNYLDYTVPEVDFDFFMKAFLPPLKEGINIEAILSALKSESLITSRDRWEAFEIPPNQRKNKDNSSVHEDKVFAPLGIIFEKAVGHATRYASTTERPSVFKQSLVMRLVPNEIPGSQRGSTTRPDAYLILKEADDAAARGTDTWSKTRWWYDIALTGEFKKSDSDEARDDDVSKIVFSMQHTMSLDPCRRFTFGMTMENTSMRLWFSCRSLTVVSEAFDFTRDPECLTRIFLSLAFASKEELGWDPTMKPFFRDDTTRAYRIEVNGLVYETVEVLSDFAADTLVGRATRVWKVKLLKDGKFYVLEDVWVDDDRRLEHEIRKLILEDVEAKYGQEARNEVAFHLLTPVRYWLVSVNGRDDHTTKVMMRGKEPSFDKTFKLVAKEIQSKDEQKSIGPSAASDKELLAESGHRLKVQSQGLGARKKLHHRLHYRIVFEEVATPLFTATRLSDVFLVLKHAAKVLAWVHGVDWVHRDISSGNLYSYNNRGLIGDLEYAKRKNDKITHEMRTGTLDFMAAEAIRRGYDYIPQDMTESDRRYELLKQRKVDEVLAEREKSTFSVPFFFHNELHDLESLWWAAIWELFFFRDVSQKESIPEIDERRIDLTRKLFPRTLVVNDRQNFFQSETELAADTTWLPKSLARIVVVLDFLRDRLRGFYIRFETIFPTINPEVFSGVQDTFREQFEYCEELASGIELIPYKTTGNLRTGARGTEEARPSDSIRDPRVDPETFARSASVPEDSSSEPLSRKRKLDDPLVPQPPLNIPRFGMKRNNIVE